MRRITLFAVCAIAAAALVWLLSRAGDLRDAAQGADERAALQDDASRAGGAAARLRQGAGTVGPRLAPLAARKGAAAQGDAGVPDYPRAPDPSPGPDLSGTGAAQQDASSSGGASGVAVVTPGSGPAGAGNAPSNPPGVPPDPLAFAGVAAPGAPGSPAPPAPEPVAGPGAPPPSEPVAPPAEEGVQATGPLTPEQIAAKVDAALEGLPPEEAAALEPVLTRQFTIDSNRAAGWVGASPKN